MRLFIGKLDIRHMAGCIAACDYFISNDTGLMRATTVGTSQIALFGLTNVTKTAPRSQYALIVDGKQLGGINENPIRNIIVDNVLDAFEELKTNVAQRNERKRALLKTARRAGDNQHRFPPFFEKDIQKF